MPRRARLVLPNIPLHIIQRGNNRQACFYADEDYRFYLDWLGEHAGKIGCRIHAYDLMTNHVHLLISSERPDAPGALMKALGQRYVQYVNRTYRRSGTLWEGRFRSCLTQEESYLLACQRYIVFPTGIRIEVAFPWEVLCEDGASLTRGLVPAGGPMSSCPTGSLPSAPQQARRERSGTMTRRRT